MRGRGFTLVEVMVAATIVAVGVVGLMTAFLSGLILVESSRNMAVASADAKTIFEQMRQLSSTQNGLVRVRAEDWNRWFQQNIQANGLKPLPQERIYVSYKDPLYNLLEVGLTVTWAEHNNRTRSAIFNALLTERY